MKLNMGGNDRIVRFVLAAVFATLYLTSVVTGIWGIVLLVIGAIFLLTSLMGFCPLYFPFKLTTRKQ